MKAPSKSSAKSSAPRRRTPSHGGGQLNVGNPGNKGGTGRPPNWLKDWCDDLLAKKESKDQVEAILGDKDHPAFKEMWKAVADRAHGKPAQPIEASGNLGLQITVKRED